MLGLLYDEKKLITEDGYLTGFWGIINNDIYYYLSTYSVIGFPYIPSSPNNYAKWVLHDFINLSFHWTGISRMDQDGFICLCSSLYLFFFF